MFLIFENLIRGAKRKFTLSVKPIFKNTASLFVVFLEPVVV